MMVSRLVQEAEIGIWHTWKKGATGYWDKEETKVKSVREQKTKEKN